MSTTPTVESSTPTPNTNLVAGLAMAGGLGILLILIGFIAGVFDPNMNSGIIGLTVLAGILCLIGAIVTWAAVVRPFDHFDDINVAQYHGHEGHDAHDDHARETEGEVNATTPIPADHAVDHVKVYPVPDSAAH